MDKYEILREFVKYLEKITDNEQQIDKHIDCVLENVKLMDIEKGI
ncbi:MULTISPECIES: hypothetical protein [Bacillus]|uniref:Uncharacterized protein n=1 Tax=Bacillus cereus HuB4-4 TaxID=1053211 RepID=A0A9W5VNM9_BACCE|nr:MULTISPECIES: hypothetical protein [Bacillus cereus group]EOP96209.1 hypothetical protein IGM_00764 [Bacillus cereus HuB4-4]